MFFLCHFVRALLCAWLFRRILICLFIVVMTAHSLPFPFACTIVCWRSYGVFTDLVDCAGTLKMAKEVSDDFDAFDSELWDSVSIEEFTDVAQDNKVEVFCNGVNKYFVQPRFTTVVETAKRQKTFLENGQWHASPDFSSLPYIWHRPRKGRIHHMADVI